MRDVLLITWHGIHGFDIFPGLPDTGGQNVYVQNMADTIHDEYDCRVVVVNRGGYNHPYTNESRSGLVNQWDQAVSILHAEDDLKHFVPDILSQLKHERFQEVKLPEGFDPDLIISHFWDGGLMGEYLKEKFKGVPHVWIPHEPVGIKMTSEDDEYMDLHNLVIRKEIESRLVKNADYIGTTSHLVTDALDSFYFGKFGHKIIPAFPAVDTSRFYPREFSVLSEKKIRGFADFLNIREKYFRLPYICEFGRSDVLKRKDLSVEVFAEVCQCFDELVMFMNLDRCMESEIADRVDDVIKKRGIEDRVVILSPECLPQSGEGSLILPELMATSKVFLSMSEMEGFGMAACEAAACGIPVVGTDRIPVLTDTIEPHGGGFSVSSGNVCGAAGKVISILNMKGSEYTDMKRKAYNSVIPQFTWSVVVRNMINACGF